jgi:death-on-curing protein
MQFLHPDVEREYERWQETVGALQQDESRGAVGVRDVLRAHFLIVDYFIGSEYGVGGVGPRDVNLLHSAVSRQFVAFGMREKWPDPLQKCATLIFGLVMDHPFHDANKRTAFLVMLYYLDKLCRTPRVDQREFENFIIQLADHRLGQYPRFVQLSEKEDDAEVLFVYDFIKRKTRQVDKRPYTVTYHVLNQILRQHGFELVNPNGNYIDLVRVEHSRGFLGLKRSAERKETRLAQIGFPGWKKQVGRGALQTVRKAADLTPERGYDSKVFFEGADPLSALISIYEGPLRRLADR